MHVYVLNSGFEVVGEDTEGVFETLPQAQQYAKKLEDDASRADYFIVYKAEVGAMAPPAEVWRHILEHNYERRWWPFRWKRHSSRND